MSKCLVCKFAKCRWIELKELPAKLPVEEMERVVDHNISFIDMTFSGSNESAYAEERMYARLTPYTDELEARKTKKKVSK